MGGCKAIEVGNFKGQAVGKISHIVKVPERPRFKGDQQSPDQSNLEAQYKAKGLGVVRL